ncbi:MAG: STAS domain-containing protein [Bythopirellula sp.]
MFKFEAQGAVEVVTPEVALTLDNAEQLFTAISEKSFAGQPMVVLDMVNVPLIDSAGLETLLDMQQKLRESAGSMKVASLTQLCADVFRVTGLAERFETYEDVNSAVRSFVK